MSEIPKFAEVDAALQKLWDSASAPEWVDVTEAIEWTDPITGGRCRVEIGHYVLAPGGGYVRAKDDVE